MKRLKKKILSPATYGEKTTWLGVLVLLSQLFDFNIPAGGETYIAQALSAIAGLVLFFVSPKKD